MKLRASFLKISWAPGWFSEEFLILVAFLELFLAVLWLVRGRAVGFAWYATMVLSLSFALVALTNIVKGYVDCGCFGDLRLGSMVEVVSIGSILVLLMLLKPTLARGHLPHVRATKFLDSIPMMAICSSLLCGMWMFLFESRYGLQLMGGKQQAFSMALAADVNGQQRVGSQRLELGHLPGGKVQVITVTVKNTNSNINSVLGFWRSCSCLKAHHPSGEVAPLGEKSFTIDFHVPTAPGNYSYDAALYTSVSGQLEMPFVIGCTVD